MTIIVYCPASDVVYSDSKHSWSDGRAPFMATKVKVKDRFTYVLAGCLSDNIAYSLICAALDSETNAVEHKLGDVVADVNGFGREKSGKVFYFSMSNAIVFIERDMPYLCAHGSGRDWFLAYWTSYGEGRVKDAILETARCCDSCGGPIDQF